MENIFAFEEKKALGGYVLNIYDHVTRRLKKVFISEYHKKMYEEQFGNQIISDIEFYRWYKRVIKNS